MVDKQEIMSQLNYSFETTGDVTIDDEGLVTCTGNVSTKHWLNYTHFPSRFKRVDGYFFCAGTALKSLVGAPVVVGSHFWCQNSQLEHLGGAPERVLGDFTCQDNLLKSLVGAPTTVGNSFLCQRNPLESLEGLPTKIPGVIAISWHKSLPLLRCLVAEKGVSFISTDVQTGDAKKVAVILNKYAGQGKRAMFDCQKELEDAGFEENARW